MKHLASALALLVAGSCASTSGTQSQGNQSHGTERVAPRNTPAPGDLAPMTVGEAVFHRRVLENGLHAAAAQDAGDDVSVFLLVGAGKRQETLETNGLAHLTEHAMYAGTARTAADEHERRVVALGGESNAFTRDDYTLFYDHAFPVEHLDEVLAMEADRLRNLAFDEAAVLHERERLRLEEEHTWQPLTARTELLESVVFRVHPYGVGVLDEDGHTRAPGLGIDAIREFYDRYYQPDNVAVVVAGPLDPAAALAAVERAFGGLPRGPERPAIPREPDVEAPREHRLPSNLSRDRCEHVWLTPGLGDPDRTALDVLARILVRRTTTEGAPIFAQMGVRVDREMFRVAANGERAGAELEALLDEVRAGQLDPTDVETAVNLLRDDYASLPMRARPYFSLAGTYGVYAVQGHAEHLVGYEAAVDRVTAQDLQRVARRHLAAERRITVVFEGTGEEPEPLPDDPQALWAAAQEAEAAGDLDRAIAAFTKLLQMDTGRKNTVIHLASRGQLKMQQRDYDGAIADFERALAVVDYPAVRDLLREARELEAAGALRTTDRSTPDEPPAEPEPVDVRADLLDRLEEARVELEHWRGLAFLEPVAPEFVAQEDAAEKLGGWYEPDTGRLVVVEGKGVRFSHGTLLHELHHALQDQQFDLLRLHEDAEAAGPDAARAADALVEGEAMLAVAELMDYDFEQHAVLPETGAIERARFEKIYQYGAGLRFVRALRERGGWRVVNEAFETPPLTTAEIYHPERYPAPAPDPLEGLAVEGRVVVDERLGEFELRWLLVAEESTRAAADALASRLAADRHRLVELDGGERREHWDLRFEDDEAARQLVDRGGAAARAQGWTVAREGRDVRLERTP